MKHFAFLAAVACLCGCDLPGTGRAGPINYTEQFTASGSLGTTTFTDASVTITGAGDTTNATGFKDLFTNLVTATVTVAGKTATFTDIIAAFDFLSPGEPTFALAGFQDNTQGTVHIMDTQNSSFSTYDLTTAIGPLSGGQFDSTSLTYPTSDGPLAFTSLSETSTFTATLSPTSVPEPASLTLLGLGAAGLVGYGWRRKRAGHRRAESLPAGPARRRPRRLAIFTPPVRAPDHCSMLLPVKR